jgi:ATP-binding cassette subfamily B protein/subfamily B ATP-binding cassette protein MsbA
VQQDHTSRRRYEAFRALFKRRRLEPLALTDKEKEQQKRPEKAARRRYLHDYIRWLGPYVRPLALMIVMAVVVAGLDMAHPLFMRYIIDDVLLTEGVSSTSRITHLHVAGAAYLLVIVLGQVLGNWRNYRQQVLNKQVMLSLRRALHHRLLHLPLHQLSDLKTGGIVSRLSGDVDTTAGLLQMAIISPGVAVLRLLMALGILFFLNWRLAASAIGIVPGIMLVSFYFARRVRPIYRAIREDANQVDGRVAELFGGIRVVRAFQREPREQRQYSVGHHTIVRKELFSQRREMVLWGAWGFLLAAVSLVIVWFGGYLEIAGSATVGDIMAFQWYTFLLLNPVWQIVNSFSELQRSLAAMERVFEILALPQDKPDPPDALEAPRQVSEMRFVDVSFAYRQGEPVVSDFNLTVPGGSVVALVGRSGAGKTTLTDLVARFHDPTQGQILLNGIDLRKLRLRSYRQLLAVVQQDVFLFDGTVRENIAYARRDASAAEIIDAARRANAHEFIAPLPDGYDSIIGERGVKLSGGQRQRLAIARALLADPQILILDEATSNLDTESEQLIQASLTELLRGRTSFVIAHRLSTITHADLIVVMDAGRIVEQGTHPDLMRAQGTYYSMVTRQQEAMALRGVTACKFCDKARPNPVAWSP